MGLEFLARVRHTSLWAGVVAGLFAAVYVGYSHGIGLGAGVAWSLANLIAIERLIVALTGAGRGTPRGVRDAGLALLGLLLLFAAGAVMLARLPLPALAIGFLTPFAVMTLKAASLLVLPSRLWRRITRDARYGIAALVVVAGVAWLAATPLRGAPRVTQLAQHAAPAEAHAAGEHEAEESGPQKFPNFITVLSRVFPRSPFVHFLHQYEVLVFSMLIAALLCLVAWLATRNARLIPSRLQNVVEMLVETLHDFVIGILGEKHGPRFVPFLGSLFLYILAMNLFGLIPFMESPTSSLNVTVALALTVFVYSQWIGLRELGVVGWIDHLAGNPRSLTGWLLVPLMLPIHILGELAKPISLSCRLFGNVFGEDMLLVAFASLGVSLMALIHVPVGLPFQFPFLFLALLTGTLQALVFTVLSTIYFLLMLPHDEHEHEEAVEQH